MNTYRLLKPSEAHLLAASNTAANPIRLAFKDSGDGLKWVEGSLLTVSLRSDHPYSVRGLGVFELCAQIIEKFDPVASGYNPKGLKESEVGVSEGWRLLTKEEHEPKRRVFDISYRSTLSCGWSSVMDWLTFDGTLRTKKPAGFYLPKADVFVAWTLKTAPRGFVLVRESPFGDFLGKHECLVVEWNSTGLCFGNRFYLDYADFLRTKEHSLDGGKTWSPCGSKEAAE